MKPAAARVLAAIAAFLDEHGYSPSVRGLVKRCGYTSTAPVYYQLRLLREAGYITFTDGIARSIVVLRRNP